MTDKDEKTEYPTPKKIEDARKEGNVPKSQDLSGVITLFVAVFSMMLFFPFILHHMFSLFEYYFSLMSTPFDKLLVIDIAFVSIKEFLFMVLPFAVSIAVGGIVASFVQFGFLFSTKPIMFDINKINPIVGAKNLFSIKKLIESIKITFKSFTTLGVGFVFFFLFIDELHSVSMFGLGGELQWFRDKAVFISFITLFILFVFAMIDLFFVRKYYFKELKMSKQEVKDEIKSMQGDPVIKSNIRQVQMEISKKAILNDLLSADVIIADKTECAVGIKYDENTQKTPQVVSKGINLIAKHIIQQAKQSGIIIVQNPSLSKKLYRSVAVGEVISEQFFNEVAEVLAHIYKVNKK